MTKINKGGTPLTPGTMIVGMPLRDYFAAKAMQAIIAKLPLHGHNSLSGVDAVDCDIIKRDIIRSEVCRGAYNYADAMIKARGEDND